MDNLISIQEQNFSYLGKGSKITGQFQLSGNTRISCEIDGEISMIDDADLFIEPNASFIGNIHCHNIEIHGQFEGTLKATGLVAIFPPASVTGDIQSDKLVVYPGAILNINGHTSQD